jgi:hypothetical protein
MSNWITPLNDELQRVRVELNHWRSRERKILKDMQKYCIHPTVTRYVKRKPIEHAYMFTGDGPIRYDVKVTIKCTICGKILNKG